MLIGLPVKLARLPDLLADSKLNYLNLLKTALLSGYKVLGTSCGGYNPRYPRQWIRAAPPGEV